MAQTTIAIVADCDDTLAPDTTGQLLELCGINAQDFFQNQSASLVRAGWDPTLAYMRKMVELTQGGGPLSDLTQAKIRELADELEFYPGVPDCFQRIKENFEGNETFRDAGVRVESYVISGGISDLLQASVLRHSMHHIWACDFEYDSQGVISFPRNVISFTDKTRFLYMIHKGKVGPVFAGQPYAVNDHMTPEERPIPFSNMIYIGDGPSDIPCMSMLQANGGFVIGVLSEDNPAKTWALGFGRRPNLTVPPDFREGEIAYKTLLQAVWARAEAIAGQAAETGPIPQH